MSASDADWGKCVEWVRGADLSKVEARIEVTIPGKIEAVAPTVDRIIESIREEECIKGHEFEVEVALLEAIGNAVEHGCQEDRSKEVSIWVACCPECGLLVVIRDPGEGFDPSEIPNPVEQDNLLRTHGRGVWLINKLMDGVHYANGGTEIRMHKRPNVKK
ncbi:MAG: ATP-binding protein [Thermoanaerobaculales bacterium]|nr:ATP-binding protein [Thermoanaerobaculales bacterium]